MKLSVLIMTVLAFIASWPVTSIRAAERPNFLVITWEDVSPHFGCYGDKLAHTPTIDRLAAEGVRFDKAFAVAGVCAPSRSAIVSARWPVSLGSQHMRSEVKLPPDFRCFPAYLRDAGYYCINPGKTDYNFKAPADTWDVADKDGSWSHRKPGQPFVAVYNFEETHQGPSQRQSTADAKRAALPKKAIVTPEQVSVPGYFPDTPGVRQQLANVHNNIARADQLTGELLKKLREEGLEDDTIVIFYGDHGDGIPRIKTHLYHVSLRVPLIVKIPAKFRNKATPAPGSAVDELVSLMDLGPTMLSLAGIQPPAGWDGRACLGEHAQAAPRFLFGHRDRVDFSSNLQRAVHDGRWHYIRDFRPDLMPRPPSHSFEISAILQDSRRLHRAGTFTGPQASWLEKTGIIEELYDTQTDPHCLQNLATDPAQAERLATMRGALREWQLRVKDLALLPESVQARLASQHGRASAIPADLLSKLPDLADAPLHGKTARAALTTALDSANATERFWAVIGLGTVQATESAAVLQKHLTDPDATVATAAAWSLHRLGHTDSASLEALRRGLKNRSPFVQLETLQLVHHIGPAAAPLKPDLQRLTKAKTPPPYARQIGYAAEFALKATQSP
jgi:arylsulfatase A-like enzyme